MTTGYGTATTSTYYYMKDHLGSVHMVLNIFGGIVEEYEYDAWGNVKAYTNGVEVSESTIGNRYLWQGRECSWATGLYYFRARWYDPVTGRWLSKDPVGIASGLNQYVFCGNNPVNFIDPFGLWTAGAHDQIIAHALGGLLSAEDLRTMQQYGREFDRNWQAFPFMHSMRREGETIAIANESKDFFVQRMLSLAQKAESECDHENALRLFAHATHPLEDSTSPVHVTPQGDPREWLGGLQYREHTMWSEGVGNLTPGLLGQTDTLLRNAYNQVFGK